MTPTATARGDLKDREPRRLVATRKRHRLGLSVIGPLESPMRSFHWSSHTCRHGTDAMHPLDSCFEHALIHDESLTISRHSCAGICRGKGNSILVLWLDRICVMTTSVNKKCTDCTALRRVRKLACYLLLPCASLHSRASLDCPPSGWPRLCARVK
jgi:hypothetical protein